MTKKQKSPDWLQRRQKVQVGPPDFNSENHFSKCCRKSRTSVFKCHKILSRLSYKLYISSLFKKEDASMKKNYRPITVLPSVSKTYERLVQDQMLPFVQSFMSSLLCGFREGYVWYAACIATFCGSLKEDN